MIDKINQQKNISEVSARKTEAVNAQHKSDHSKIVRQANEPSVLNASKSSAPSNTNIPRSAASIAAALGLPQDKLSSSIISFARFFSLPLKSQLLADLRRQAFAPPAQTANQSSATKVAATKAATVNASVAKSFLANTNAAGDATSSLTAEKTRYALSLSAAAAESKGLELSPKGLESYAQAVDPDSRRQNEERQHRRRNREQDEQTEKVSSKTEAVKKPQGGENSSLQLFTADSLKKMFFEYAEQNQLLEIINSLPCKNGQRWIVFPFDFVEDGKKYNVSMRVLLDEEHSLNRAVCMALDIIENENIEPDANDCARSRARGERSSGEANNERRWLFVMESANDKPMKVSVYIQDELSQKSHLKFKHELSNLFKIPIDHINIKNRTEPFPYEASFAESFPAVDEAV
jgi:hypothetical protein